MTRSTLHEFPFARLFVAFAVAAGVAFVAAGAFSPSSVLAEEPKPVIVTNVPTVKAQQQGPWTVDLLNPVTLSSNASIGIDPARNVVRLAAPQSMQASATLFIDYPDKSWSSSTPVPSGKQLTIEYVSGEFEKRIGSTGEQTAPALLLTLTTTANGQTASHVVPVFGVYTLNGVVSFFQVAHAVKLYADGGTNVTLKLEHLFSPGYQYKGAMNLSGHLDDVP
jgi:hypothetical protein